MAGQRTTLFYVLLVAVVSTGVGMVLASRLDLVPESAAGGLTAPPPMNSTPLTGPVDAHTFREIAHTMSPVVVNIKTRSRPLTRGTTGLFDGDEMLRRFFDDEEDGDRQRRMPPRAQGTGSGFIIDQAGLILTNSHVVEDADEIDVGFFGGSPDDVYPATVVGRDPLTDSALIQLTRLPDRELPVARFGDSDLLQPGDWVMAIGNPFNFQHSISVGVVSGLGRPLDVAEGRQVGMLQTDAIINPGNSGGPMLNIRGEVVGINTAILADRTQHLGIGFAVPINLVRGIVPQLRAGEVTRGVIGVRIRPLPSGSSDDFGLTGQAGAIVAAVEPGGPASRAGLEPGDVIVEFGGQDVEDDAALVARVTETPPGTRVPVRIVRDRRSRTLHVVVAKLTLDEEAPRPRREAVSSRRHDENDLGVTLNEVPADLERELDLPRGTRGALVAHVEPYSAAANGALARGDVIIEINGQPIASAVEAAKALEGVPAGRLAKMLVVRGTLRVFVPVRK